MDHWGALSQYIILACNYHADDECVLMINKGEDKRKIDIVYNLKEANIFSKIILNTEPLPGGMLNSVEEIQKVVQGHFDFLLSEAGIILREGDDIYTSTDIHGIFRYYLTIKKVKYTHVMLANGDIYSDWHNQALLKLGVVSETYMNELVSNHVFDAKSTFCTKMVIFPGSNIASDYSVRGLKFLCLDIGKEFGQMGVDCADKILSSFATNVKQIGKIQNIVLTNSNGFLLNSMSAAGIDVENNLEHTLLYQELIDFYGKNLNGLIIKPHPNSHIDYENYFNGLTVFDKDMPIEFLCLNKELHIENVLCLQTTALEKISGMIGETISVGVVLVPYYHALCEIYVIGKLVEYFHSRENLSLVGLDEKFFAYFYDKVIARLGEDKTKEAMNQKKLKICYKGSIDDFRKTVREVQNSSDDMIAVFMKLPEDIPSEYFGKDFWNNIAIIRVTKSATRENTILPTNSEYIFVYFKSGKTKNYLQNFYVKKELKITGIAMQITVFTETEKALWIQNYSLKNELGRVKKEFCYFNDICRKQKAGTVVFSYN